VDYGSPDDPYAEACPRAVHPDVVQGVLTGPIIRRNRRPAPEWRVAEMVRRAEALDVQRALTQSQERDLAARGATLFRPWCE